MKYYIILAILLFASIFQISFLSFFTFYQASLDLILVIILLIAVLDNFKKYWLLIIISGLFLDCFSALPFGAISLSLLASVYLLERLKKDFFGYINFGLILILIAIGTVSYNLLVMLLSRILKFDFQINWLYNLIYLMPQEIIYNIILASFIYYALKKISAKKQFVPKH